MFITNNHVELHAAAMRPNRDASFKLENKLHVDEQFFETVHHHISRYIQKSDFPFIVFSAEGLSYLYYEDELLRLQSFFQRGVLRS